MGGGGGMYSCLPSEPPSIGSLGYFLKRQCGNDEAGQICTSHPILFVMDTRELGPCVPQLRPYLDIDLSYVSLVTQMWFRTSTGLQTYFKAI